jgi:hypothetical protein
LFSVSVYPNYVDLNLCQKAHEIYHDDFIDERKS